MPPGNHKKETAPDGTRYCIMGSAASFKSDKRLKIPMQNPRQIPSTPYQTTPNHCAKSHCAKNMSE